jgi:hypothetical protein
MRSDRLGAAKGKWCWWLTRPLKRCRTLVGVRDQGVAMTLDRSALGGPRVGHRLMGRGNWIETFRLIRQIKYLIQDKLWWRSTSTNRKFRGVQI